MCKSMVVLIILAVSTALLADGTDIRVFMKNQLAKNTSYQQVLNRLEQEKALNDIDRSVSGVGVTLGYKQYDNDITREERASSLEKSTADERDKRWQVELSKQFFAMDFDQDADALDHKINLLRYRQDEILAYSTYCGLIWDDLIQWFRCDAKITLLNQQLQLLYAQNKLLEELSAKQQVDADLLIENWEQIDELEDDLSDLQHTSASLRMKYDNVLSDFVIAAQSYTSLDPQPDTLAFHARMNAEVKNLDYESGRISRLIRLKSFHSFLPEIDLSLSYNWRRTKQDWEITKNNTNSSKYTDQKEVYPEGGVELSFPLDLYSNTRGKSNLIRFYQAQLQSRTEDLSHYWLKNDKDHMENYAIAKREVMRKSKLRDLYRQKQESVQTTFRTEPFLLGANPELVVRKATLKRSEMELEQQIAELKLYKEIFLINSLCEDRK